VNAVAGYVAGEAVPRRLVDDRIGALRAGPYAAMLPSPGSAEDRQLARWVAQVVLTERLCAVEARRMRLPVDSSTTLDRPAGRGPDTPDRRAAVELGSITAAAYAASPAVRAVYAAVSGGVDVDEADVRRLFGYRAAALAHPPRWVLRHGLFGDADRARGADPRRLPLLGEVTAEALPLALAEAVAGRRRHDVVGPIRDRLGWHVAYVEAALPARAADYAAAAPGLREEMRVAAARRAFARWLDRRRAELVVLVTGLEHPADPSQPDCRHRH
jgi:[acyl-carrier-protein] S-malonyltransferase